jgi:(p)ppGpp synthase/HD superfamily hydrolase
MHLLYTTDEELQCIALGHDLIEDTDTTTWDLENLGFPKRIVDGIWALTRSPDQLYALYQLQVMANPDAIRVKICDLHHNMDSSRGHAISPSLRVRYAKFLRELERLPQ